ncbi:Uma2 family endonuclease [Sphaerisporangium viridialbum]|uniref:Uma2 family endonuclease n=1 Tax=Sphaerisporangium viridialbum TaxID=46189 RepID=UPI003C78DD69
MVKVLDKPTAPTMGEQDVSPVEQEIHTGEIRPDVPDDPVELEKIYYDLGSRFESTRKVELVDGRVVVREMPTIEHARVVYRLLLQLIPMVMERGWEILPDIAIFLGPQMDRYRPDATVVPADPPMWQPDEVYGHATHLIVEVVSKSSAHDDHIVKPAKCAVAGIPLYLVIDTFERTARLLSHPRDGEYGMTTTVVLGEPLELPEPWGLTIDTGKLVDRSA